MATYDSLTKKAIEYKEGNGIKFDSFMMPILEKLSDEEYQQLIIDSKNDIVKVTTKNEYEDLLKDRKLYLRAIYNLIRTTHNITELGDYVLGS